MLNQGDYPLQQAQDDWKLSVQQCIDIPLEWCAKPQTIETMRWLWEVQLGRVKAALQNRIGE